MAGAAGEKPLLARDEWEKILNEVAPAVRERWQAMGVLPALDLPKDKTSFVWDNTEIAKLPTEFWELSDEHRLVYWSAKAKGTTPWPLGQGETRLAFDWSSQRIAPKTYENFKQLKATTLNKNGPSAVGPVGSVPSYGLALGGYPALGQWR